MRKEKGNGATQIMKETYKETERERKKSENGLKETTGQKKEEKQKNQDKEDREKESERDVSEKMNRGKERQPIEEEECMLETE